jgi:8-oxo-dGTP pyrophosphatase MutT (NUDIX family)
MSNKNEIAVSSVAAFNPEGKLLFGLRTDAQKWTLPGGHANDGEAPEACAERELYEEAGLKPKMLLPVGEGRVPLQGGEDIRVTAFVAMVEGEPTAENDPDSEIEEFRWVDVSKGLPHQIADNLFAPMNVVLRILGLQQGKLLKTEAEEREIVSSYFGDAQPQWWDLLNTLSSFTNIPDAGRRTIARILLTEGQYKPLIENMRMGAHFDLGRVLDRVVNAQREVMEKRHLPKSNTTDGRSIMRMLISGRHNIASMYDAMSEEDDYDDLTPEQLETKAKDLLRQADGIRENGATGNIFPKFDNPEEADRAEMAISLDNETAGRGPAFRQAVQRYMQIVQDTASLSAQDTVNEINAWQKLRAEFPEVQETMGHIAGVGTRLLFYQTLLMKRRQAEAFFANPETYTDPAKRTEMMQRLSSSEAMSPKALKQVVQHAQAPEVLKAVRHDKANDDVYRAALERDWSNTEDGMKREIIDTLVYARRRPSNDSKYMSDSTTQFMVDKYDKTFRQIFLHNMSWLTPSAYIKYITDPDIIATHPLGALSAVSQNKEFFDKHGDDIIDAVLKAKEKAVDEDTDHFIRSNAGVALNWIQNKSASKASALRVFNAWPEVAAPLIARRGDLDSHDIYRFVDWARYNPEASSSVGYLFGKNPDARPEHLLRLLDPLLQRTAKNCVIAITQRAEEPERQKLFNREVCERVLSWPDPIARGHMLQENVGAYVPKDLLDRAISTETDGRALQGLAFNKLADLHTLGAYMAGHMEKK